MDEIKINIDSEILASFKAMQENFKKELKPLAKLAELCQTTYSEKLKPISEAFERSIPYLPNFETKISKISNPEIPVISSQIMNLLEESYFGDIGYEDIFIEKKQRIGFRQPYSDNR